MTGRERMLKALRFEAPDQPPHFELVFELAPEAFGARFPDGPEWSHAAGSPSAKDKLLARCCGIYEKIVNTYRWDALLVFAPPQDPDGVRAAKARLGREIMVGAIVWEGIWSIDIIKDWGGFSEDLVERPEAVRQGAERLCRIAEDKIDRLADAGAEFIVLASDVGFNGGPFVSPEHFRQSVTPYLARLCERIRRRGSIPFFHSDGQLMPILDQILEAGPQVLHSIDPMAGMDIAAVKRATHGKLALMGNVQCSYLQHGPDAAIRRSCLYCLEQAAKGGGYIFSSSNTIFRGVPLRNYEYMLSVFGEYNRPRRPAGKE